MVHYTIPPFIQKVDHLDKSGGRHKAFLKENKFHRTGRTFPDLKVTFVFANGSLYTIPPFIQKVDHLDKSGGRHKAFLKENKFYRISLRHFSEIFNIILRILKSDSLYIETLRCLINNSTVVSHNVITNKVGCF